MKNILCAILGHRWIVSYGSGAMVLGRWCHRCGEQDNFRY